VRTKVGLWIGQRKALIVAVTDKGEEIRLILSKVEKQPGRSGGDLLTMLDEPQIVPAKAGYWRLSNWKKVSQLIN
jgi:hypothetical protein